MSLYKVLDENLIFSKNDLYLNFDKWQRKKGCNILIITGLSGSGKTTLAEKLEKKYNATMFELDGVEHNYDSSNIGILDKAKKKYPRYKKAVENGWKDISIDQKIRMIMNTMDYILFCMENNEDKLYIVEGIQFFEMGNTNKIKQFPIIIKGTSVLKSFIQRYNRNHEKEILKDISGFIKWYKKEDDSLFDFKKAVNESNPVLYNNIADSIIEKYYFVSSKELIDKFKDQYPNLKHIKNEKENDGIICLNKNKDQFVGIIQWDNNTKYIVALFVAPQYRNQGIATVLIRMANKRGIKKLSVNKRNDNAINLYKKLKYKVEDDDELMYYMVRENTDILIETSTYNNYDIYNNKKGVFAKHDLTRGRDLYYILKKKKRWILNPVFKYIKHSPHPNVTIFEWKSEDTNNKTIYIRAKVINPIKKGKELTINYSDLPTEIQSKINLYFPRYNPIPIINEDAVVYDNLDGVYSKQDFNNKNGSANIGCLMIKEYYDEPWFISQYFKHLNHSENPNCKVNIEYSYNKNKEFIRITQIKPIKKGEEITINYNDLPYDALDALLNENAVLINEANNEREYKCPFCDYHATRSKLVTHVDKVHKDMIPKGYTAARVVFNYFNHKDHGTCVICKRNTPWNEDNWRYDRLCGRMKCKEEYIKRARMNLKKIYGKENLLGDIEQQKKMLAGRSISGKYKFKDGGYKDYVGSYEKKFLEFMDQVLEVKSTELYSPGPVIDYNFKGKKLEWITDFFYDPFNLVIEVKDGGNNPNNRQMIEYREKQLAKEKAIKNSNKYNYIRLTNNNFKQLLKTMLDIKESLSDEKIIAVNEYMGLAAVGGLPSWNGKNSSYIIPVYQNNSYIGSVMSDDEYINNIYRVKDNKIIKDNTSYLYDKDYKIYKSKKKIDKDKILKEDKADEYKDYFYTLFTGKDLISSDQYEFEESFEEIEDPYINELYKMRNISESLKYKAEILSEDNIDLNIITEQEVELKNRLLSEFSNIDIKKDINGYFIHNLKNNCRSQSYNSIENIPKVQYYNIENMIL